MKEILFKCRKSIVSLMKLLLFMALMGICFGLLSLHNPQIIKMSRTAAVTGLTFVVCGLFMTHIYGTYDIGKRKSPADCSFADPFSNVHRPSYLRDADHHEHE